MAVHCLHARSDNYHTYRRKDERQVRSETHLLDRHGRVLDRFLWRGFHTSRKCHRLPIYRASAGALIPVAGYRCRSYAPQTVAGYRAFWVARTVNSHWPVHRRLYQIPWDWVFWVNLPVGILAVLVASSKQSVQTSIDYPECTLWSPRHLLVMTGEATLYLERSRSLGMSALSVVMLVALARCRATDADPPPTISFREPIFTLGGMV